MHVILIHDLILGIICITLHVMIFIRLRAAIRKQSLHFRPTSMAFQFRQNPSNAVKIHGKSILLPSRKTLKINSFPHFSGNVYARHIDAILDYLKYIIIYYSMSWQMQRMGNNFKRTMQQETPLQINSTANWMTSTVSPVFSTGPNSIDWKFVPPSACQSTCYLSVFVHSQLLWMPSPYIGVFVSKYIAQLFSISILT